MGFLVQYQADWKSYMRSIFVLKWIFFSFLGIGLPAYSQLSPGPLSRVHASIDDLENCKKCHDEKQGVSQAKCASCHTYLQQRIEQARGLHANPGYARCVDCHWEHQGWDESIIIWPKGRDNFEHQLTGYALTGKHTALKCEQCHQPVNIHKKELQSDPNVNLNHTFLGLTAECLNCHQDEHRGQTKNECQQCHDLNGWKPASGFNHEKTDFPLLGRHSQVGCEKCHTTIIDNKYPMNDRFLKLKEIDHNKCENCHKDPHQKRFGTDCQSCHSPENWKKVNKSAFDHNRTNYALKGKHQTVACEKCHLPGAPVRIERYQKCTDCHRDYHQGQLVKQRGSIDCERCHTVDGFRPSTYSLSDHNQCPFPLLGAHRAVPCVECHPSNFGDANQPTPRFTLKSDRCTDCHRDPHPGSLKTLFNNSEYCLNCHNNASWHQVTFDHDRTNFKLIGKHQNADCQKCHMPTVDAKGKRTFIFKGAAQVCSGCHEDVHQGQFRHLMPSGAETIDCTLCHDQQKWAPVRFDHRQNARFPLEGAHVNVSCSACHKKEIVGGRECVRYRPISYRCEDCHTIVKERQP